MRNYNEIEDENEYDHAWNLMPKRKKKQSNSLRNKIVTGIIIAACICACIYCMKGGQDPDIDANHGLNAFLGINTNDRHILAAVPPNAVPPLTFPQLVDAGIDPGEARAAQLPSIIDLGEARAARLPSIIDLGEARAAQLPAISPDGLSRQGIDDIDEPQRIKLEWKNIQAGWKQIK